jgi:hypothetical protein
MYILLTNDVSSKYITAKEIISSGIESGAILSVLIAHEIVGIARFPNSTNG